MRKSKEAVLGPDRVVLPTERATEKAPRNDDALESVQLLPTELYKDIVQAWDAKGVLDLAVGQGQMAQACLANRTCFVGFGLTEQHCQGLEKLLTDKILQEMKDEGSTFYRPEMAVAAEADKTTKDPKPKKQPKKPKENVAKGGGESGTAGTNEPPPKKLKTNDEGEAEEDERSDSMPW